MKTYLTITLATLLIVASGCTKHPGIDIRRLDMAASAIHDKASFDSTAAAYSGALAVLEPILGVTTADSALALYAGSAAQQVFAPDIQTSLGDLTSVSRQLGEMKDAMAAGLPAVKFPSQIVGFATPYNQSVIVADTVLLLGLNHYLGADYDGYRSFEAYRRDLKIPARIVPDIAEALIASTYPYRPDKDATALSRMLYEGALLNAMSEAMPWADDTCLLGYTSGQLDWAKANEQRAWQTMAERRLIYSIDPLTISRLVDPAPSTAMVNPSAPGRLGRYIGLQIVRAYKENSGADVSAADLLDPSFYNSPSSLQTSRYAP